jgi:hypothetical protein
MVAFDAEYWLADVVMWGMGEGTAKKEWNR